MGKSEKAQINECMKEKHVAAKVEETSKLSVGTIDWTHVCNRCHLSLSIVFIASLFLMAPFIHIHNWEQFKKELFFFIMFSTRFTSVNLLIFSPQKINA